MRSFLLFIFGGIFVGMVAVTGLASMEMAIWDSWPGFAANPWAIATLWDAYFGFLTFYVWLAWRESKWSSRVLWFVAIMGLGNLAMSFYVLRLAWALRPGEGVETLLLRPGLRT